MDPLIRKTHATLSQMRALRARLEESNPAEQEEQEYLSEVIEIDADPEDRRPRKRSKTDWPMTTDTLTRAEMIQRLIEEYYDESDYKDLYLVEYYLLKQYANYTDQEIDTEYTERFEESWLTP